MARSAGRSRRSSTDARSYLLCVDPGRHADLQARRLYQVVADERAARSRYVRVIDDSGEDYLYPASRFVAVALPEAVLKAMTGRKAS